MKSLFIPRLIDNDEVLVRAILSPIHYDRKKARIKREAFLPPKDRCDISLVRLNHSSGNRCKKIAKSIRFGSNTYFGLAAALFKSIMSFTKSQTGEMNKTKIISSPWKPNWLSTYFQDIPIFLHRTPEHADLLYPRPIIKGSEPDNEMRQMANEISRIFNFAEDSAPKKKEWKDADLALLAKTTELVSADANYKG